MTDPTMNRRAVALGLAGVAAGLAAPVQAKTKLKLAAIYTVPFEQLWVSRVHMALRTARQQGEIEYKAYENIALPEFPVLMRKLAQQGFDVIFGEVYQVEEAVRKVAAAFPKTAFVFGSNGQPQAPNVSVFDNYVHEPAYLEGMLAGGLTRSGHIGIVGGFPAPDVKALMNAFMAGAREINPQLRFSTGVIYSWLNPPRGKRLTDAMMDQGADVVFAIANAGVVETAAARGGLAFGSLLNQQPQYPNTVVASALWHVEPVVQAVLAQVRTGQFKPQDFASLSLMKAKGASLSPLGSFEHKVPPELLKRVRAKEADILSGRFKVPYNETLEFSFF